ncbi:hypothetical protein ONZ51_g13328 [Trametes cubensis]|uniref:Uncharacterized protein n=1 Tax=Trametes cubensis TaxID=1111947 RepID=A0AAD7TFJ4_9APHY|nr:hypothetical protein ONZ51_g13328 [Trametes cubensis]
MDTLERAERVTTLRVEGGLASGLGAAARTVDAPRGHGPAGRDVLERLGSRGRRGSRARQPFEYVGYAEASGDLERKGYEAYAGVPLPFPALRRIEIARVDFPIRRDMGAYGRMEYRYMSHIQYWALLNRSSGPYGFDVPGFVKGLRARVERGAARVERVDFVRCQCVQRERLRPLVEAVQEVYWDGKRLTLDDLGTQEAWSGTRRVDRYNRYSRRLKSDDEASDTE